MRFLYSVTLLAALLPAGLFADSLSDTDCGTHSYAYYEANFGNLAGQGIHACANGILNYSNFQFQSFGTESALVSADDITISAVGPGRSELGDTGFTISGLSVGEGQTATYVLDWYFEIDPGPYAGGGRLGLDPGDVTVSQSYCVDSYMSPYTSTAPATCSNDTNSPPPLQTLTVTFANPDASLQFDPVANNFAMVRTIIQLNGGDNPDGASYDLISGTTAIYDSAAPEPGTLLLIPAGLLLAGLLRKRSVRQ